MNSEIIARLHAKAGRCRELAAKATDPEVAEALARLADEIDAAIPVLEDNGQKLRTAHPA